jgi:hypothetical protein
MLQLSKYLGPEGSLIPFTAALHENPGPYWIARMQTLGHCGEVFRHGHSPEYGWHSLDACLMHARLSCVVNHTILRNAR